MSGDAGRTVELTMTVPWSDARWELADDEERMPENPLHGLICDLLKDILRRWTASRGASAQVGGNIALRWDAKHPKVGADPDVYLVEPAPPNGISSKSLCTWKKGHHPPRVVVEVVSDSTAETDYHDKPARYGASGTHELWVFDPELHGPLHERCKLQVWRRSKRGAFRRVYAGDGPAFSDELNAWLVLTDAGMRLRIADNADATGLWPTAAEAAEARADAERAAKDAERAAKDAERAAKDAERAAKDAERAAKEAALAEIERLRAELARRG